VEAICDIVLTYVDSTLLLNLEQLSAPSMSSALSSRGLIGALDVMFGVATDAIAAINAVANETLVEFDSSTLLNSIAAYTDPLYNESFGKCVEIVRVVVIDT